MIYIVIGIIILLIMWFISTYNSFIKLRNACEEAFSTMDVYLKKRFDLIPNLVETVKGYASHESETFEGITKARSSISGASDDTSRLKAEGELSNALSRLLMINEAYPELKADQNFLDLQNQLKVMEGEITNARKYYNAVVNKYNIKCETIPSNIIASICKFVRKPLFEVSDESQRENVSVKF